MTQRRMQFICAPCAIRRGCTLRGMATWHVGLCDVCGQHVAVTEPRDFEPRPDRPQCTAKACKS